MVFWDYIGQTYFPHKAQVRKVKEVVEFAQELIEPWEPRGKRYKLSFIDSKINDVLVKIKSSTANLDRLKRELIETVTREVAFETEYIHSLPLCNPHKPVATREFLLHDVSLPYHFPLYSAYSDYVLRNRMLSDCDETSEGSKLCMVCSAQEHSESDVVVICSGCEECVHAECYGIRSVPEEDWYCDGCVRFGFGKGGRVPCALCPVVGAAVRPTINRNDGSLPWVRIPPYDPTKPHSPSNASLLWCHVLCAKGIHGVHIRRKDLLQGIDISKVQSDCINAYCDICDSSVGAAIRCTTRGCKTYFHVECTKSLYKAFTEKDRDPRYLRCKTHSMVNLREAKTAKVKENLKVLQGFWTTWAGDKMSKAVFQTQVDLFEGVPNRTARPAIDTGFILTINLSKKPKKRRVDVNYVPPHPPSPPIFTSLASTTLQKENCPCGKPYVPMLPQREINEDEYARLLRDMSMVCCEKCEQWFHYRCARFSGDEKEMWLCTICRS